MDSVWKFEVAYNRSIAATKHCGVLPWLTVLLALITATSFRPAVAQAPNQPQKPKAEGNCTVSGRVISAAEGTPLRSAQVGLIEANQPKHPLVYATTTDNEGHFEIKQVQAARYEFLASHTGYLEQRYQAKGGASDEGVTLSLTSGQTVDDALFQLTRAGVITGKVVDDAGEPMVGANVAVLHKPSDEELEDAGPLRRKVELTMVSAGQTDDRGEYRIFNIKPGEYYVKAANTAERWGIGGMTESVVDWRLKEELGSLFAPIYYPGVLQLDQAQAITLSAGEEAQADFAMRKIKMVEVAGRVIGPDGGPASRVYVRLSQAGVEDWGGALGAGVDSNGEFSVKGVTPGSYIISAAMHEKDKYYNTRQKIEVGEAKIDSLVLTLGTGATIHGRMRTAIGAPLPSTRSMVNLVSVVDEGATGFGGAEVNKDGTFELSGVADGTYAVMASAGGEGWFVKSAHLGNEDVQQNGLLVENGAVKGSLDIVVSNDGAQIEGTVTDSDKGQPLTGVVVRVQVDPSTDYNWMRSRSATTDQNGHYVLKDIPPYKYKVTAKMPKPTAALPTVKSEPATVTLADHDHRVLDFKLTVPKSE